MNRRKRILVFLVAFISLSIFAMRSEAEIIIGDQVDIYIGSNRQDEPSATYDSINKRFLVAWDDHPDGRTNVYAQLVNSDGSLYAGRITICETVDGQYAGGSKVVFDPLSQRFLVVWGNSYIRHPEEIWVTETHGQFVNTDGSLSGGNFAISPDPFEIGIFVLYPLGVVFDTGLNRFFVLIRGSQTPCQLYGRFVNPDSSLGDFFQITNFTSGYGVWNAKLGFDSNNSRFLAAFGIGNDGHIDGILLNADGTFYGSEFVIAESGPSPYMDNLITSLTFDPLDNRFLAAWTTAYAGSYIHGQLVNSDGSLYGGMLTIKEAANGGSAIFDNANRKFLVLGVYPDTFGQLLNPDGSLFGTAFTIMENFAVVPILAGNSLEDGSLAVYPVDFGLGSDKDIYARLLTYINNPPVLNPIGDKEVTAGELLTFEVSGSDPEPDPLSISSPDLPEGATLVDHGNGTATFSWTPSFSQRGKHNVTLQISDGEFTDEEIIVITVKVARTRVIPFYK